MKKLFLIIHTGFLMFFVNVNMVLSQDQSLNMLLNNKWGGKLEIESTNSMEVVFKFRMENDSLKADLDSPNQGVKDLHADSVSLKGNTVYLKVDAYKIDFKGKLNEKDTSILGIFSQGIFNQEMLLKPYKINRPQEPQKPYPYIEADVTFKNRDISLSGTITIPEGKGPYQAVVLISGSGPQNRNEEIFEHKPFLVLADYLCRKGYAVLRYDDRGTAKSSGDYKTAGIEEFAADAYAGFRFLKNYPGVDSTRIGLIGHSEGAMIAPLLASKHPEIAFIIMMAGPGVRGDELLLLQSELIFKSMKMPESVIKTDKEIKKKAFSVILSEKDTAKIRTRLAKVYSKVDDSDLEKLGIKRNQVDLIIDQYISPEILSIIRFDPCPVLKKVKCPVLAINGEKDLQVPPRQNLAAINKCLTEGKNQHFVTKELWYLNHLFQSAITGSLSEYYEIEETISPLALETIEEWLMNLKK